MSQDEKWQLAMKAEEGVGGRADDNVRFWKNMLSCQHSNTLDWLTTEHNFTQVQANTRRLKAGCISPLWEEITEKSGCWVIVGSHTQLEHVDMGTCINAPIGEHFPDINLYRHTKYYEASELISMMSSDSVKTSVCLTVSDTLKKSNALNHWDQTPSSGSVFIFKSPSERHCVLFYSTVTGTEIQRERLSPGHSRHLDFTVGTPSTLLAHQPQMT